MNEEVSKSNVDLRCRHIPIERGFVWAVVEYLQELTSAQVKHELGIDTEIVGQSEAGGVLLPVSQYCHNDALHYCNCNKMDLASFVVVAIGCDASSCNKANKPQLLADFFLGIGFPFPFWLDSIIQPPMTQWIFPTGYKGGILTNDRMWPKREVLYIIRSVFLRRF